MSRTEDHRPAATGWHVPAADLRTYAAGRTRPPGLWSVEAHLAACPVCRGDLARVADPEPIEQGWLRLDARLDEPSPGGVEKLLVMVGVPDHTARLVAASPALRLPWLTAVALTLALTAAAAHLAQSLSTPVLFLAVAPLLPLAGVAVSFGPGLDPTYEITLVAPVRTFRLLLLRSTVVLATTVVLSGLASLAVPHVGLLALGWLLPALVLTVLSLALTPSLGQVMAPVLTGLGWFTVLAGTMRASGGDSVVLSSAGQLTAAVTLVVAAGALVFVRDHFDTTRSFDPAPALRARRLS